MQILIDRIKIKAWFWILGFAYISNREKMCTFYKSIGKTKKVEYWPHILIEVEEIFKR